jgi:hypothetical protein
MKLFLSILLMGMTALSARTEDSSNTFVPGEVIEYKIYWVGIPIAWARITTDTVVEEERELIRITMIAHTYKTYTHIFEVDDKTEVIIDPETALPIRHDWIINEGTIHKSHLTTFYHDKKVAVFQDRISKDIREIPIESDTQEVFSFIYGNRSADIEKLAARKHRLLVTGKLYDLELKISDHDKIRLPHFGKVASMEIEPIADFDGIFLRKGKVFFWISKEPTRVVTYIKTRVALGRITAKIHEISSPVKGFWSDDE